MQQGEASQALQDPLAIIESQYKNLCCELNLDTETYDEAWRNYLSTRTKFTLEGDPMHWLACSLYVACRRGVIPTVGRGIHQGNGVSLTRLLRSTKLSLIEFFKKAKSWADMNNMKKELSEKIDKLERNFSVSLQIFKKYQAIYVALFKDPSSDPPKQVRSRKSKRPPCSPGELFDFCWTLFIRVKAGFPGISDDLVNSYHLLLATIDYIYSNAVTENREDLLNPSFRASISEESERSNPCILDKLCSMFDGIINEVKTIREHYFRKGVKNCFENKSLSGDDTSSNGVLESSVFDLNCKNVRKDYEIFVLSIGEYDERVFLGEDANEEIGTPTKRPIAELEMGLQRRTCNFSTGNTGVPNTPLSGRHFIKAREQLMATPVSSVTYLVSCLNKLLSGRTEEPSKNLTTLVNSLSGSALEDIKKTVTSMGETFVENYNSPTDKLSTTSFAGDRLKKATILFYKVLEKILIDEKVLGKNIIGLIEHKIFHQILLIACLEIVIFSYNSPTKTFPWALDVFQLEAYQFYKIIEILIRTEDGLARDVVKHLQLIEERILERLAWQRTSPVWAGLEQCEEGPSCEQVSLPLGLSLHTGQSPISHLKTGDLLQSPLSQPGERFKSPTIRRQLFNSDQVAVQPAATENQPPVTLGSSDKPRKTGSSLHLFFRKVYNLAKIRLDALCKSLNLQEDILQRVWTVFEWTLMKHCTILKDRHLDQILMCVLYTICKIREQTKNFTEILRYYRNLPQADSHVYRSVLLKPRSSTQPEAVKELKTEAAPPTPSRLAVSSTVDTDGVERGDLIKFFNTVFLELPGMKEFVNKFSSKREDGPPLSPVPNKFRANTASPCRKVSEDYNLYIKPLKPAEAEKLRESPVKKQLYSFGKSPAKALVAINTMLLHQSNKSVKRKIDVDGEIINVKKHAGDDSNAKIVALSFSDATKEEPSQK